MISHDSVVIYQDDNLEWRWRRTSANNEIIADSAEGYLDLRDCRLAIVRAFGTPYDIVEYNVAARTDEDPGQ